MRQLEKIYYIYSVPKGIILEDIIVHFLPWGTTEAISSYFTLSHLGYKRKVNHTEGKE